jgi:hypothetical protein
VHRVSAAGCAASCRIEDSHACNAVQQGTLLNVHLMHMSDSCRQGQGHASYGITMIWHIAAHALLGPRSSTSLDYLLWLKQ